MQIFTLHASVTKAREQNPEPAGESPPVALCLCFSLGFTAAPLEIRRRHNTACIPHFPPFSF